MTEDRLITVAIHTYEKAVILRNLLESEGVSVTLQNVNLVQPVISSGVRVRIHESDLPLALRVIENSDIFCIPSEAGAAAVKAQRSNLVLVPIDGTDHSDDTIRQGFRLAAMHKARVLLLHAYMAAPLMPVNPMQDTLTFVAEETWLTESEEDRSIDLATRKLIDNATERVKDMIKRGEVPPVRFKVLAEEGLAEEVINRVARREQPLLIVMGTRSKSQKQREMMGSVAAEVLDTCRQAIITIPSGGLKPLDDGASLNALYFGNLDQADMLAIDSLYRLLNKVTLHVTLVHIPSKKSAVKSAKEIDDAMEQLLDWCRHQCPRFTFERATVRIGSIHADVKGLIQAHNVDLLAMPNKKRNVFARFFNPTLPHRLLFAADLPMAVIPV